MEILAKTDPPIPLRDHLVQVQRAALGQLTPARLAAFERMGVGHYQAEELVGAAAWLHDFGKATVEWQEAVLKGCDPPQHALSSFLAALWALGSNDVRETPPEFLAVALAVLAHHGQLSKRSFVRERYRHKHIGICRDEWHSLADHLPAAKVRCDLPPRVEAEQVCSQVERAKERCPDLARNGMFRGVYALLLTILVAADHAVSAGSEVSSTGVRWPRVPGEATTFQVTVGSKPGDALCAVAACGSGKTAAALMRAARYAEQHAVDRVVICLPTRFTSNSLLRDMIDPGKYAYPKADVGLVHSEALYVLQHFFGARDQEDEERDSAGAAEEAYARAVRYEYSVTVSTVDHLLMSLYHGHRFSDRAFGNLLAALVVFDEIQAYDTTTLNAIREGMHLLQRYRVPTLVMSATVPSSLRAFFGFRSDATVMEGANPFRPFRVVPVQEPLTLGKGLSVEASSTAKELLRGSSGLKLAVYVNQIERAKALARAARQELAGTKVFCYHSELAACDRADMEDEIVSTFRRDEPVVLIATQAAELSLDISSERIITELAPADVLIQRSGRLNRRGESSILQHARRRLPRGFIFQFLIAPLDLDAEGDRFPGNALPYTDLDVLKRTWEAAPWGEEFDFAKGAQWCERALVEPPDEIRIGIESASVEDSVFGNLPEERFEGEDGTGRIPIRNKDETLYHVIPEVYLTRVHGEPIENVARCQVPLRRSKFFQLRNLGLVEQRTVPVQISSSFSRSTRQDNVPIWVVRSNVPYDAHGVGFDFKFGALELPAQDTEDWLL